MTAAGHPRTPLSALLLAQLLCACGGGSGGGPTPVTVPSRATVPPAVTQAWTGHYVGTVTIAGVAYFGDAVFSEDGLVRLYVGGPYDNDGVLQLTRPTSSEQFVGTIKMSTIKMNAGQGSGSGLIFGQECGIDAANRFCGQPASAEITAAVQLNNDGSGSAGMQGGIKVTTSSGAETWPLNLGLWSGPALATAAVSGQYQEVLAEFASGGAVIMNVDRSGNLTFQSAGSGCVGNGALTPHLGGADGVYDVALTLENCNGAYTYLNGRYDGLALYTASSYWDYDSLLRMWLSNPTGETPPAALTTLGE